MITSTTARSNLVFVILCMLTLILCLVLIGCGRSEERANTLQAVTAIPSTQTPIVVSTLTEAEVDATKNAYPLRSQETSIAIATSWAQGTRFPVTPIPLATEAPIMTPRPGINGDCAQGSKIYDFGGCWNGVVNDERVFATGFSYDADPSQGILAVMTTTMDLRTYGLTHTYDTPEQVGLIKPIDVAWPLITLLTVDSNPQKTFVFNLETREWVTSPPPSPSVSVSPQPSPSASP